MAIHITSKYLENNIKKWMGVKVIYIGKVVDEHLKIIKPIKYAFFNLDNGKNNRDFLLTFDEKLILTIVNKI
jgi:hypothetical protein